MILTGWQMIFWIQIIEVHREILITTKSSKICESIISCTVIRDDHDISEELNELILLTMIIDTARRETIQDQNLIARSRKMGK